MSIHDLRFHVVVSPYSIAGRMFLFQPSPFAEAQLLVRHMSEYFLWRSGATWHPDGDRCPTWTNSECRCMLGGDA